MVAEEQSAQVPEPVVEEKDTAVQKALNSSCAPLAEVEQKDSCLLTAETSLTSVAVMNEEFQASLLSESCWRVELALCPFQQETMVH